MQSSDYDAVIIGAGISGLAAAWSLRHRKVLVLEAADRVGGRILSLQRGAYWLNLGAHLFGGPDTAVGRLVSEAGLETRTIPGSRMGFALRGVVLTKGRPETYPFRVPLSLAGKLAFIRMGLRLRRGTKRFIEETTPVAGEPESPDGRGSSVLKTAVRSGIILGRNIRRSSRSSRRSPKGRRPPRKRCPQGTVLPR